MHPSVSAIDAETLPRHRWYFFKEAFSPKIVEHAINQDETGPDAVVFDPFTGSGTTPLVAGMAGRHGHGTEVNPFMRFVAKTKTLDGTPDRLHSLAERIVAGIEKGAISPLLDFSTFSEKAEKAKRRGKWLFNSEVLNAFEGGMEVIRSQSGTERELAKLCLIGSALDAANAAKDGKCLRYKKQWDSLKLGTGDVVTAFKSRIEMVAEDLDVAPAPKLEAQIFLGDSRSEQSGEKFDLCVTSPPYLNSFDYTDVYRPELFLGGFVKDMGQLRKLRLATVRSHVQASWEAPTRVDFGTSYSESMKALFDINERLKAEDEALWDKRLPLMIQAYFEDMERVLKGLRARAKSNASVWLVVSTSAYAGVEFPVDLIIADIAGRCGWLLREVTVLRHLKRVAGQQWDELSKREGASGPHLRESVVILDADKKYRPQR